MANLPAVSRAFSETEFCFPHPNLASEPHAGAAWACSRCWVLDWQVHDAQDSQLEAIARGSEIDLCSLLRLCPNWTHWRGGRSVSDLLCGFHNFDK
jgi:hypothetical protein